MVKIVSYELGGPEVFQHFVNAFEMKGRPAPNHLFDILTKGKFFALAPEGIGSGRIKQFNLGGVAPSGEVTLHGNYILTRVGNLASSLARIICRKILGQKFLVAIREPYLKPGDKTEILNELSFIGDELFTMLDGDILDEASLSEAIRRYTVSWSFLLMVADQLDEPRDLDELVSRSNLIAVNAYDGESYLYWLRDA